MFMSWLLGVLQIDAVSELVVELLFQRVHLGLYALNPVRHSRQLRFALRFLEHHQDQS